MEKRIEILFGPEGEVEIEAFGYQGKGCKDATKFLEEALGTAHEIKQKAEWFVANSESVQRAKQFGYNAAKICG